jgi:putative membrane protein insertion efficiency factor
MKFILLKLIMIYKKVVSPILPSHCRFVPSCSNYAVEAITEHGCKAGLVLTIKRLMKCHPWGSHGFDPVPTKEELKNRGLKKHDRK